MECGREFRPSDANLKQVDDIPSLEELMEQQYAEQDAAKARGEEPAAPASAPEPLGGAEEPPDAESAGEEEDLSFENEAGSEASPEEDLSFEAEASEAEPDLDLSFEAEADPSESADSEDDGFEFLDVESESEPESEDQSDSDPFDVSFEESPQEAPLGVEPSAMEDPEPSLSSQASETPPELSEPPTEGASMETPVETEKSKAPSADPSTFNESEAAFQEIREFGEAISEGKAPPPPKPSAKPNAAPLAGGMMAVAADHLEGFKVVKYLSPISMIVPVSLKDADPLAKGVNELSGRASSLGANAIVGLRASFTPDGKSVLLVGSPVVCEPK